MNQQQKSEPLSPDSKKPDPYIRSDRAIAAGFTWNAPPPPPVKCPFCGETLYHLGVVLPFAGRHVLAWNPDPERCCCPGAVDYWRREDIAREEDEALRQRQEAAAQKQAKIDRLILESGIRTRFQSCTFDRFIVNDQNKAAYLAVKKYADTFSELMLPRRLDSGRILEPEQKLNGLFITGTNGTGKTHLATATANQLIQQGIPAICMTMIDLLARIKRTFDRSEGNEADILGMYETVPLLVIDDLGSEQATEWGSSTIFTIINARYESCMPVVITTNYTSRELVTRMAPPRKPVDYHNALKTIDRLRETCVGIEMNGKSWRIQ